MEQRSVSPETTAAQALGEVDPVSGGLAGGVRPHLGQTRLLWVETPANPMWEITDLAAVCELAHAAGVRVAVDNTVSTRC